MSHWAPAFAGVTGFSWIHDLSFDHSIESESIQKNTSITTIRDHTRSFARFLDCQSRMRTSAQSRMPIWFTRPAARSEEMMVACGHRAMLGYNLNKLLRYQAATCAT